MIKVYVDSREQRPLTFGCDWERKGLPVADYGCSFGENHMHNVLFERKSCNDLYGSLTQGYDRFRRMFQKAAEKGFTVIIAIECSKEKVLKGVSHSAREPESIIKQLETINIKYGVSHIFFPSRISMQNYIVDYYNEEYQKFLLLSANEQGGTTILDSPDMSRQ